MKPKPMDKKATEFYNKLGSQMEALHNRATKLSTTTGATASQIKKLAKDILKTKSDLGFAFSNGMFGWKL